MRGVVYLIKEGLNQFLDNLLVKTISLIRCSRLIQLRNLSFEFINGEEVKFILIYKRK